MELLKLFGICALALALAFTLVMLSKLGVKMRLTELADYGDELVSEYSDNGMLPDSRTLTEVLDRYEEHLKTDIDTHCGKLYYERTDSSIVIDGPFMATFVFAPNVDGTY